MSKSAKTPPLEYASSSKPWKPHAYQKRAMKFLLEHAGAGLFLDPGLGKTSITLGALKVLRKEGVHLKALVIAPLRVCGSVWPAEAEKWKDFEDTRVVVLHGKDKEELLHGEGDVFCMNPEGLEWLFGVTKTKLRSGKTRVDVDAKRVRYVFTTLGFDTLVVDESTKFKHSSSQRFKILKLVLHKFHRRWILTGTPAPNGLMDLFSQVFIMDLGNALGEYITHYRATYFNPVGFGGFNYVLQEGAAALIYKKLKNLVLRLAANDYLDVPEIFPVPHEFELPASAREIYDVMEDEMVVDMDLGKVTAPNAATASGKCSQIANGGLYKQTDVVVSARRMKGKDNWMLMHNVKTELARNIVDELNGQPVLIAYEFDHDLARLKEEFGEDMPYIGGGVSLAKSKEIEKRWNRGEIPVLALQPASAAHGLNLQGASEAEIGHVIWYGITWDYELFDQLIKRLARQGSKHKRVFAHLLIARKTVDVAKWYALRAKEKGQNNLLDALRVYVKSRASGRSAAAPNVPTHVPLRRPKAAQHRTLAKSAVPLRRPKARA